MGHKEGADVIARGVDPKTGDTVVTMFAAPSALSADADGLSQFLYTLTELVIRGLMPDERGGGLGGEFGYGVNFENDVFMLHRYCWCQRVECPWCRECVCEGHWDTSDREYAEGAKYITDSECINCREKLPHEPNFRFKPTGFSAHWYKWIGRDTEPSGDLAAEEFREMAKACFDSIPVDAHQRALAQVAHESTPEYLAEQERLHKAMIDEIGKMFSEDGEDK